MESDDKTSEEGFDGTAPLLRGSVSADGAVAIDGDRSDTDGARPEGPRLSRGGAWLAMGAVALALLLIYVAPGTTPSVGEGDEVGYEADAAIVGSPAPMHF